MITAKNKQTHRLSAILGISLVTTLLLVVGSVMIRGQRFSPFAPAAHAAALSSCALTRGSQYDLCEHQDPIVEGCVTDAETLDLQTVFQDRQQLKPLGEVELRYSPTCNAYWIRTTAFATKAGVFKRIHAVLTFHDQTKEDSAGTPVVSTITPYVAWTDMTVAPIPPHGGSGSFDLFGRSQSITITLKE